MRLFSRLMAHLERVTVFHRMMGLTWVSLSVILLIGGLLYSKMGVDDFIERAAQNPRDTEMAVRAVRQRAGHLLDRADEVAPAARRVVVFDEPGAPCAAKPVLCASSHSRRSASRTSPTATNWSNRSMKLRPICPALLLT